MNERTIEEGGLLHGETRRCWRLAKRARRAERLLVGLEESAGRRRELRLSRREQQRICKEVKEAQGAPEHQTRGPVYTPECNEDRDRLDE